MRRIVVLATVLGGLAACSGEEARPIDLQGPTSSSSTSLVATPHAVGENPQARFHAERQCREDPELDQGVIRIVDPASDAVVGEVVVECAAVRDEPEEPDGQP